MSEDLIITEEELNSLLNNLDLKFIAQKLKIENVDKSIITLIKIVKSLQQENKQLKEELQEANDNIIWWSNRFNAVERDNKQLKSILTELEEWLENNWKSTQDIWYVKIINKIQELKEKHK